MPPFIIFKGDILAKRKRSKKVKKRNKKLKRILINLIIIMVFIFIIQFTIKVISPNMQNLIGFNSEEKLYQIKMSDNEMTKLPKIVVDKIYVYGEVINIDSNELGDEYKLNLYDTSSNEVNYQIVMDDFINVGINGYDLPIGSFFLQTEDEKFISYNNDFTLEYNTITRDNQTHLVTIDVINGLVHITKQPAVNSPSDEVDILIDPGHGGVDTGTQSIDGVYYESELNLQVSLALEQKLTDLGYHVEMTRIDDTQPGETSGVINAYQEGGRVTQAYDDKAKLVISNHHNSGGSTGFEVYSSVYATTEFSQLIVDNLMTVSNPSNKQMDYISDGLYQQTYTETTDDGEEIIQDYMYMIREVGGVATRSVGEDNYPNNTSIYGSEGVLVEFGYLDEYNDLAHVSDPTIIDEEAEAIATAIDQYLNRETSLIALED